MYIIRPLWRTLTRVPSFCNSTHTNPAPDRIPAELSINEPDNMYVLYNTAYSTRNSSTGFLSLSLPLFRSLSACVFVCVCSCVCVCVCVIVGICVSSKKSIARGGSYATPALLFFHDTPSVYNLTTKHFSTVLNEAGRGGTHSEAWAGRRPPSRTPIPWTSPGAL